MDWTRLEIASCLALDILDRPLAVTEVPRDREVLNVYGDEMPDMAHLLAALEAHALLTAPEYYGDVYGWKQAENVYRGTLLQDYNVTEAPIFTSAAELADWFTRTVHAVVAD